MATAPPAAPPAEPGEPSNRWPWVALALGVLIIVVAAAFYFLNRPRTVAINVEGTPTANPVARAGTSSPGPPPTVVPPTLPASATLAPTATPPPTATPQPPTPTPVPTSPPPTPTSPPTATTAGQPAAGQPEAAQPAAGQAPPAEPAPAQPPAGQPPAGQATPTQAAAAAAKPAAPTPTPFAGQVANAGGAGNTRQDLDAAYGAPAGETAEHLVVYRKNNVEYHVGFVPDPNGRAALIVEVPGQAQPPWPLDQAMAEARKLVPKDAQPTNPPPEGNDQFAVQRATSQSLAQALAADAFTANKGQPGQFLVVYARDPQGRITRIIVGAGNDPQALIQQGR